MEFILEKTLKALLFSTSEPLSTKTIQKVFERYQEELQEEVCAEDEADTQGASYENNEIPLIVTGGDIRQAIEAINQTLEDQQDIYRILETPEGYQVSITPEYAQWVRLLRDAPKPLRLSKALMETLTIIAYRQPVTRAEMEAIRGVSVDNAIAKLVEHELIHVHGRADLPGRPMQYATSKKFLEFCGIQSLEELPGSDVLSPEQLKAWVDHPDEDQTLSDDAVGLSVEDTPESNEDEEIFLPKSTPLSNEASLVEDEPEAVLH